MPKKNKFTGAKYKVGSHPIKAAVNEWISNLTRLVAHPQDKPWALLLESEATLTIKSLTNSGYSQLNIDTSDFELSPIIKEDNIVIPQPDCDQLNKIKSSYWQAMFGNEIQCWSAREVRNSKYLKNIRKRKTVKIFRKLR